MNIALQAVYAEQQQRKLEREANSAANPGTPPPRPNLPDMMRAIGSADAMAKADPAKAGDQPVAQKLMRADAMARFKCVSHAEVGFAERLVHFWCNHFTVSARRPFLRGIAGGFEREAIRPHVFGRFTDMLLAVERHPAMLLYLDNAQSIGPNSMAGAADRRRGLNENLAREILELHTLGVDGGYTQDDVRSLARILTGWMFAGREGRRRPVPLLPPDRARAWCEDALGQTVSGQWNRAGQSGIDRSRAPSGHSPSHSPETRPPLRGR